MTQIAAVIGLGYVGLPLARRATECGVTMIGFDVSDDVVIGLMAGHSHVDDIADEDVERMFAAGFTATSATEDLSPASTYVISVPTPLSPEGGPDLSAVVAAGRIVASVLSPGDLVVLESTSYPGTTEDELRPILEESGLVAGRDFHLAFSPERIDPGNPIYSVENTPKVVGGLTPECRDAAIGFYARFIDRVVGTKGLREAEMAKLLENTYRHVNIALVNEMSRFCAEVGIDLWDAIDAAATKPFGFQAFYPGPGVGGHCIPIDPNYLSHFVRRRTGEPFRFVELAQEINAGMPAFVVQRVAELLARDGRSLRGAQVLLLGVTYKADIADCRESPANDVRRELLAAGAEVTYHDPYVPQWLTDDEELLCVGDLATAVATADCAVLLQAHRSYDPDVIASKARRMLDTRGVTTGEAERL